MNKVGSRTDVGCVRGHNEDSILVLEPLYAVADGMGGHEAGEVASEIAVDTLAHTAPQKLDSQELVYAVKAANAAIIEAARTGVGKPGMGTTLTAAMLEGHRLLIAQVGDSRAYLLHNGTLQQVTRDHSLVEELVSAGEITEAEAAVHPKRSIITRALGSDLNTVPDIYEITIDEHDRLLLCSDGLSNMLDKATLTRILSRERDPQGAADALIAAAREAGGYDNISAIVVDPQSAQSRKRQKRRRQRSILGVVAFIILFAALVSAACGGLYLYAYHSAFLVNEGGYVAVYRGLAGSPLPGINLQWFQYSTTVQVSSLNPSIAARLQTGIQEDSLDDAAAAVQNYQAQAQAGQGQGQ